MSKAKFANKRKSNAGKSAILFLAVAMLVGCMIGGTVAWLISESQTVTNTFVAGQIGTLELTETDVETNKETTEGQEYLIVPGTPIAKDPKVTYTPVENADGKAPVAVYVFVEIGAAGWTKSGNVYSIGDQMSWTVDSYWTCLEGNVYYKELTAGTEIEDQAIIAENKITVSPTAVNEDNIEDLAAASGLNFSVYAIQKDNLSVADAWVAAKADAIATPAP